MKIIIFALVLMTAITTHGQTRTFRWEGGMCTYSGTYDAKKYSLAKLKNTLKLSESAGVIPLSSSVTAWKPDDIARLDVGALEREFAKKSAELKTLDIVPVPYWEEFRKRKLRNLEQAYRLNRASLLAYQEPRSLLGYTDAPACTTKYANPLISGGDDLLKVWQMVYEQSRVNNADPERLRRVYEEQLRSPDKMRWARIEVINFGWYNCANRLIDFIAGDETPDREFRKLFKRARRLSCEEP